MEVGASKMRPHTSWIQYRYVLILLGFFGLASAFAMRVNFSVAMVVMVNQSAIEGDSPSPSCPKPSGAGETQMKRDGPLNWDRYDQGLILGAFYYGYIITPIPGGRMAERFGAKWLFGLGVLFTGLLSLLIPYAAFNLGATGVVTIRVLQGLGEGVTYPSMEALIAHWFPVEQRTTGVALVHAGGSLGVVVGMAISGILADSHILGGWPSIFYFFGAWTVVWFVFWGILLSSRPEDHPWVSQGEIDLIVNSLGIQKPVLAKFTPWKKILTSPAVIAIGVAQFGASWLLYTLVTELPTYLGTVLHFNIKDNGIYSAMPYLGAILSGSFAGLSADYIRRNGYLTTTNLRKLFNGIALFGSAIILVAVTSIAGCDGALTLLLFVIAGTFRGFSEAGFLSAPIDMAPDYAGTIVGITVCFGNVAGFLVPWVTGLLVQKENSMTAWSYSFYITAGIGVISGLVYQFWSSCEVQEWGLAQKEGESEAQIPTQPDANKTQL